MNAPATVPEYLLEELAAGDLPVELQRRTLARLDAEPEGRARLAAISRSNDEILDRYPPRIMVARIMVRYEQTARRSTPRRRWRFAIPALAAAAATAAILWVVLPGHLRGVDERDGRPPAADVVRIKGDPQLMIYRQRSAAPVRLTAGETVSRGDVLQLEYNAKGATHGMIFSVDGRGVVTLHYPADLNGSTALEPAGAHPLAFAYELDDAPEFERFFLVWSDEPIAVRAVIAAVREHPPDAAGELHLPKRLRHRDVVLLKQPQEN